MRVARVPHLLPLAALAAGAAVLLTATRAHACGGLFRVEVAIDAEPAPMDQTAERVLFEVHPPLLTVYVEIAYSGRIDDFAWILPVPALPEVREASAGVFDTIAAATQPIVQLPAPECFSGGGGDDGGGCVGCGSKADGAGGIRDGGGAPEGRSPVTVFGSGTSENYAWEVIGGETGDDLLQWLGENGYNVSDNMAPAIDPYVDEGMLFVAVRFRDDLLTARAAPLALTFEGTEPMIPIRMAAVAAQPLVGLQVFVVADDPFTVENWQTMRPRDPDLQFTTEGETNYFAWAARKNAEAGGNLFVVEAVVPGSFAIPGGTRDEPYAWVSRYYTRLNPEWMTVDPVFVRSTTLDPQPAIVDLTDHPTAWDCLGDPLADRDPNPCAFVYCGEDSECAVMDGDAVCLCGEESVAAAVAAPDGSRQVTCVAPHNPLGIMPEVGGTGTAHDPCASEPCGDGTCVLRNGTATCRCDFDAAAGADDGSGVRCRRLPDQVQTWGPGAGAESEPPLSTSLENAEERTARAGLQGWIPALVGLSLLTLRRRRA